MNPQTNNTEGKAALPVCPGCGGRLTGFDEAFCPYCGMELIDLSRAHTDCKIEEVKRAQSETAKVPKKIALTVTITLLILFLAAIIVIILNIPDKLQSFTEKSKIDRLSENMESAYTNGDWEQLEKYLIYECDKYISAPDYFMYRTAWFLHTYPSLFDEAYEKGDTNTMLEIHATIAEDYDMRGDESFYRLYDTDKSIEQALKEEYERETKTLIEEGLEDEMYKLRF